MVGVLAHGQMLAFAHHVPDIAEHEQIAGHRAGQAGDVVGGAGNEAGGKAFGEMRRRIFFRDGVGDPPRQIIGKRDVFRRGKFDKTVCQVGVVGRQRRFDVLRDDVRRISQGRIELEVGQFDRIVLRGQDGAGVPGMRPQQRTRHRASRHAHNCRADPQPHTENLVFPLH